MISYDPITDEYYVNDRGERFIVPRWAYMAFFEEQVKKTEDLQLRLNAMRKRNEELNSIINDLLEVMDERRLAGILKRAFENGVELHEH